MEQKHVDIYVATRGGMSAHNGRYGYVVEYITPSAFTSTREGFGKEEETTAQRLTLHALVEALGHLKEPCDVTLHVPEVFVRSSIMNGQAAAWEANNFYTEKGATVKNAPLWQLFLNKARPHTLRVDPDGQHGYLSWLKGEMK